MDGVLPLRGTISNAETEVNHAWLFHVAARRCGGTGIWMRLHAHEDDEVEAQKALQIDVIN